MQLSTPNIPGVVLQLTGHVVAAALLTHTPLGLLVPLPVCNALCKGTLEGSTLPDCWHSVAKPLMCNPKFLADLAREYGGDGSRMLATLYGLPWDIATLRGRSSVQPAEARSRGHVEWFWNMLTALAARNKPALMHTCVGYSLLNFVLVEDI